jgi:type II secretion system protein G
MLTPTRRAAFTLVEIMIVVLMLGILAAIVIPQFTSASELAQGNAVKMDLHRIRQQIEVYRSQHNDPPTSSETFEAQMTLATDEDGDDPRPVGTPGYPLGPYLASIPKNPFTDSRDIAAIDAEAGASAWVYDANTGGFYANSAEEHRSW